MISMAYGDPLFFKMAFTISLPLPNLKRRTDLFCLFLSPIPRPDSRSVTPCDQIIKCNWWTLLALGCRLAQGPQVLSPLSARKTSLFLLPSIISRAELLSLLCGLCLLSPGLLLSYHTVFPSYLAFLTWSTPLACQHFLVSYRASPTDLVKAFF